MHYMKWSRVMVPVVKDFEEFETACNFLFFFFLVSFSIGKMSILAKIYGTAASGAPLVSICLHVLCCLFHVLCYVYIIAYENNLQ